MSDQFTDALMAHAAAQKADSESADPALFSPDARIMVVRGLTALSDRIYAVNGRSGWNDIIPGDFTDKDEPYRIPTKLALIHSEVSEALEAFRKGDKANFGEELADVLIRLVHLAGMLDIDLASAAMDKVEVNAKRPYKHGGKAV